jgi:hypothetical protein
MTKMANHKYGITLSTETTAGSLQFTSKQVTEGAVDLGRVEVGDAQLDRPVDGADRFGVAAFPDVVIARHHMAPSPMRDTSSPPIEMCFMVICSIL